MSSIIDYTDRATCVLFGDGAGAVLVEPSRKYGILDTLIASDGAGMKHLHQKAGGSRMPPTAETVAKRLHYVHQEGAAVYKFAIARMADVATELMARNHLTKDSIDWLVPHQANRRIIEATAERIGLPANRVMVTINKYGNTTAATIPLCLWDYEQKLKAGDRLLLAAFGGGFTWGGVYMTWAYDTPAPRSDSKAGEGSRTKGERKGLAVRLAAIARAPFALRAAFPAFLPRRS
jgi:3-oxoacyl-[acyl-carrier-protein] synthase-3